MTHGFARTPLPPYWAVIFTSRRNDSDQVGYEAASGRMIDLAQRQPGFLGVESARGVDGLGITVSYWRDEASIRGWRDHPEHRATRELGRTNWYEGFEVRIARVERAYASGATE